MQHDVRYFERNDTLPRRVDVASHELSWSLTLALRKCQSWDEIMELVDDDLDRFRSYIIDNQPGLNMPLRADDKVSLVLGPNGRMLRPFAGLSCVYDIEFIDSALQKHQRQLMTAAQQARPAAAQQARPAAAAAAEPVDGRPVVAAGAPIAVPHKTPSISELRRLGHVTDRKSVV